MAEHTKTLLIDIETSPLIGYAWETRETDIIKVIEPSHMLCVAYKWLNESTTHVKALPDYSGYKRDKKNDRALMLDIHKLIEQAHILVAHNGDAFDLKKLNTRFSFHGLPPPPAYKTVDTLKLARRYFKFESNKLNNLAQYLDLGSKVKHTGFDLWERCMNGDQAAWSLMKRYNKQDVVLLEKVYLKLRGWHQNHPNVNIQTRDNACPTCGSHDYIKDGYRRNLSGVYQKYFCRNCYRRFLGHMEKLSKLNFK